VGEKTPPGGGAMFDAAAGEPRSFAAD